MATPADQERSENMSSAPVEKQPIQEAEMTEDQPQLLTGTTTKLVEIKDDKVGSRTVISTHIGGGPHITEVTDKLDKDDQKKNVVVLQNSETHGYYKAEGFGVNDVIIKPFAEKTYTVNFRPLPIDQSPFKEEPPSIEDIQPITGYNKAFTHENAYIYTLNVPDRYKKVDEKNELDTMTGGCSTQSIPALTILRNNLLGVPPVMAEYPVIASANPSCAASYLHAVQHRVSKKGAIDLRFNLSATRKNSLKETYILGRIWLPLNDLTIYWDLSPDNYDAAQPILYPAFAEMGKITLDTRKELTSLVQNLRFVDKTFSPDIEQSMIRIMQMVSNTKMSLARLYWRAWTLIAEAAFLEAQGKTWTVKNIQHTHSPTFMNGPTVLKAVFSEGQLGIEPFFITHAMIDANRGLPIKNLLYLLLADNFQADTVFAVTRNWPSLGEVKMVLPSDMDTISSQARTMVVHSNDIYRLLHYFAVTLGQQLLIDEIGRTVAQFLMRPEGDSAWLGHRNFTMNLPPFRCRRSLHFAWAMQGYELKYKFKKPPFYKLAWVGSIRYMQTALAANTVFNELGVYSALQLQATGMHMPEEWYDELSRLFYNTPRGPEVNELIQRVGLRCDWGSILNKMTASISLVNPKIANLTRIVQWYEWLLFQRLLPEGTWMAGQIGHIKAETQIKPGRSYNSALCGISSGINDVFYRMLTQGVAQLKLHVNSFSQGKFIVRDARALSSCAGFPLDGQFRYIGAADDVHAYYHFVPRSIEDCHIIMHEWHERTEFHWQLYCPKKYFHTGVGKDRGELKLESRIEPPAESNFMNFLHEGVQEYNPVKLSELRTTPVSEVRRYGNPQEAGSDSSETSEEEFRKAGPVGLDEVTSQVYPIHYCDEERNPSVGCRVLKYGLVVKKLWCGVSMLSADELYNLSQECERVVELLSFQAPSPTRYEQAYERINGHKQGSRRKGRRKKQHSPLREQSILEQQERAAQEKQAAAATAAAHQLEQEEAKRKTAQQLSEAVKPIEVKKRKNEFYGWAKTNGLDVSCMDHMDIWLALDGMEDVCLSAPGSKIALQNRYIALLQKLDNLDVLTLLSQIPLLARAEFCRCMYNIMGECVQFLTQSSQNRAVHEQLTRFFGAAMDNLAFNGSLNDEELQATTGNPSAHMEDWKIIGTMDSMDYLTLLIELSTPAEPTASPDPKTDKAELAPITAEAAITDMEKQVIRKEPAEDTENFRLVGASCSVQSPQLLAHSQEANGIGKQETTAVQDNTIFTQEQGGQGENSKTLAITAVMQSGEGADVQPNQEEPKTTPKPNLPSMRPGDVATDGQEELLTLPSGCAVLSSADINTALLEQSGDESVAIFRKTGQ